MAENKIASDLAAAWEATSDAEALAAAVWNERAESRAALASMTWQQALKWCVDNPGELVYDKFGRWHQISLESGHPRLRSDMQSRAFDPAAEPYTVLKTGAAKNGQP